MRLPLCRYKVYTCTFCSVAVKDRLLYNEGTDSVRAGYLGRVRAGSIAVNLLLKARPDGTLLEGRSGGQGNGVCTSRIRLGVVFLCAVRELVICRPVWIAPAVNLEGPRSRGASCSVSNSVHSLVIEKKIPPMALCAGL